MHIILDFIWNKIRKELRKRILIVDEAWYLMKYQDSAVFLNNIAKRARKYYLGLTTITQDVDDFLQTKEGPAIIKNSSIQILLKQHPAAIDLVGKIFYLSEGEKQYLLAANIGEGIFFAGANHVAIKIVASADEHKLITSAPEEVLEQKEEKEIQVEKESPKSQSSESKE
jgi:type IV secretory pathway VirB4 component